MKKKPMYQHFTTNEIKPTGWLRRQLEIEAAGLVGNLDKMWPDVRDSQWIGGEKEGWERVPYWLDGFVPLAYLLDDDDMKARAKKYVDAILERQKPDGWICPCEDDERDGYDVWAVYIICKALAVYAECSGDERIEGAVTAALKNLKKRIEFRTVDRWASARWYECLVPLAWLYGKHPEPWIEDMARTLAIEGMNFEMVINNFTSTEYDRTWQLTTHVVNLAMALKCYAVAEQFLEVDGNAFAERFLGTLRKYHSTAYGLFTGDECLAGDSPVQGLELCGVVEAMYSFEILFETSGNTAWLDRLELLAFNALPATVAPDMWTHQYDQQVNQISCLPMTEPSKFTTNSPDAHIFGLEPNFGCCTANMGQGFPKFALSTFYKADRGIVAGAIAPAILTTDIEGVKVTVECDTEYPFRNTVVYRVRADQPVKFRLGLHIPGNATGGKIAGKKATPGETVWIEKIWQEEDIAVEIETAVVADTRPNGLVAIRRGSLLFSLPLSFRKEMHEYVRDGVERKFPYCDWWLTPTSEWRYGFANHHFTVEEHPVSDTPFDTDRPPLTLKAHLARIPWEYDPDYPDLPAAVPLSLEPMSDVLEADLIPYGCTMLRMTEMPFIK